MVGVTEATLRTWEKRYGVVAPQRTEDGYRLYVPPSIATLTVMRRMVAAGWSPSNAAAAILNGEMQVDLVPPGIPETASDSATPAVYTEQFLGAAARFDMRGIEESLDKGMSIGSFEHVLDAWLMPTLVALGEGWQRGEI